MKEGKTILVSLPCFKINKFTGNVLPVVYSESDNIILCCKTYYPSLPAPREDEILYKFNENRGVIYQNNFKQKTMISKDLFIATIDAIQTQFEKDDKANQLLSEIFTDHSGFYDYSPILIALENILKEDFGDQEESWIEYFIYDLDFGNKWTKNSIKNKDGSITKMRDASELYEFLISNK